MVLMLPRKTRQQVRSVVSTANSRMAPYYSFDDELDVNGKAYVVLDRYDGWQKLAEGIPAAYLMQQPGQPKPPQLHVDKKDWPLDLNGKPLHPWKWTHYLRRARVAGILP
jgi:hypothetical protein